MARGAVARPALSFSFSCRSLFGGRRRLWAGELAPFPRPGGSGSGSGSSLSVAAAAPPFGTCGDESRDLRLRRMVEAFDPSVPLPQALTPPSSWYRDPSFFDYEFERVFLRGWQIAGHLEQIQNPYDYFTGRLGDVRFVVCRDESGTLHAFHNVCRHHASLLARGSGRKLCFVCPYHGWTYGLDGALLKATRVNGIENFSPSSFGLVPLNVATWGPFVLVNAGEESSEAAEWLGSCSEKLRIGLDCSSLRHVCRREYVLECNWKVFCDNYLDGGYHVPYAHGGLASGLDLESYAINVFDRVSIQECLSSSRRENNGVDRLGSKALYAFVYPNFMINRYGPWMDTNLVVPEGARRCRVVFDYFLETALKDDSAFIQRSLEESDRVQKEDVDLCEGVQKGLESPAYVSGRYAPEVEQAMHHFHCLLHHSLSKP